MHHDVSMTTLKIAAAALTVAAISASALALSLTTQHTAIAEDSAPTPTTQAYSAPDATTQPIAHDAVSVAVTVPTLPAVPDGVLHTAPQPIDSTGADIPTPRTGDNMAGGPGYRAPGETYTLPPCITEDSDNCYWDAASRSNGQGVSFITLNGVTYYAR